VPPARRAEYVALRRREEGYQARSAAIGAVLGEDLRRTLSSAEAAGPGKP